MRTGKTKFTRLAKRILASTLALSMVFSANMLVTAEEAAPEEAVAAITLGEAVDFESAVLNTSGNAVEIDGTTMTLGEATSGAANGIEIVNPYVGNETLLSEDFGMALENTGIPLNAYVFRHTNSKDASGNALATDQDTYYIANLASVEAAQAFEDAVAGTQIVSEASLLAAYNGNWDPTKDIKIMQLSKLVGGEDGEVTLPYPTWTTGITVSTWVKASSDQAAPIFTFQNRSEGYACRDAFGGLTLYTDGSVVFAEDDDNSKLGNGVKRNTYRGQFQSEEVPSKNVGDWVYVTFTMKNDGATLYVNGEEATFKVSSNYKHGKTQQKYFNHSFSYDDPENFETRMNAVVNGSYYAQRLKYFGLAIDETTPTAYGDFLAYTDEQSTEPTDIMNYITADTTKLYIGGTDGMDYDWLMANKYGANGYIGFDYTKASEGMAVKNMVFDEFVADAADAAEAYAAAVMAEKAAAYDFEANLLNVSGNAAEVEGTMIKLGEATSGAANGVEIVNPFINDEVVAAEDLGMALENTGIPLNAYVFRHTNSNDASGNALATDQDTYYIANLASVEAAQAFEDAVAGTQIVSEASLLAAYKGNWDPTKDIKIMQLSKLLGGEDGEVTLPYPTWKTGITVSTWVKASSDQAAPIFTFQNRAEGYACRDAFGGLTLYTDGSVVFAEDDDNSKLGNGVKRNTYRGQFQSDDAPSKNVGEWVYVTFTMKNDGAKVYFNGEEATFKVSSNYKHGKTQQKYFNHSFSYDDPENFETRMNAVVNGSYYAQRLKYFGLAIDETTPTAYGDFLAYTDEQSTEPTDIMNYITADTTKLYIGGTDGMDYDWLMTNSYGANGYIGFDYTKASEGMIVADMTFGSTPVNAKTAAIYYDNALVPTYTDAFDMYTFDTEDDIKSWNDDVNNASLEEDANGRVILTLGEVTEGEDGEGVRLNNAFGGKALDETLAKALETTGKQFDAWKYKQNDGSVEGGYYYRVFDEATQADAIERYNADVPAKMVEYVRKQVEAFAKVVTTDAVILKGSEVSGYSVEATGGSMLLRDYMYYQAVVQYKTTQMSGGYLANANNFWKNYSNGKFALTFDQMKAWSNGVITSEDQVIEANYLKKTFEEQYPMYAINPAVSTAAVYSFPYPTWSSGAAVSAWVKVATSDAATVLEFTNGTATLYLKSDGTVKFMESDEGTSTNAGRNLFSAVYDGETPAKNVGEWVYVTMVAKNDGVEVYYDGVKATPDYDYGIGKKNVQYFNYGTGWEIDDIDARIRSLVEENCYSDALKGFGASEDYSDWSKYTLRGTDSATYLTIMELVTDATNTKLYLGGGTKVAESMYTNANAGMSFSEVLFHDAIIDAKEAQAVYVAALDRIPVEADPVPPTEEPTVEPTDAPTTAPTTEPTTEPTTAPTTEPTPGPTETVEPTPGPTETVEPTPGPTETVEPTPGPSETVEPTPGPSETVEPTPGPSETVEPTPGPSETVEPTPGPSETVEPTPGPSETVEPTATPEPEVLAGDANLDGEVKLEDANLVLKAALGIVGSDLTGDALVAADVDGKAGITLEDANIVLKLALGIPVEVKKPEAEAEVAALILKKKLGL